MPSAYFSLRCLLCSTEVGQVLDGRFRQHPGCTIAMPRRAGVPRCCHCGGSLYVEPIVEGGVRKPIARYAAGPQVRSARKTWWLMVTSAPLTPRWVAPPGMWIHPSR